MASLAHGPGEIISYIDMCRAWNASFQRGMNFRLRPDCSVLLMSRRANAPYRDRIEEDGRVLIYEGHDAPRRKGKDPKSIDQPGVTPAGKLTQNGLFQRAAGRATDLQECERVAVYEKIHDGVWVFNGIFALTDSWTELNGRRRVFKFRLELLLSEPNTEPFRSPEPDRS